MPTSASGGFTGKTLRVDLTTRTITVEPTLGVWSNGTDHSKFWGGTGQAYKILWDEVPASVKPFDPENRVHFGWGPLSGTGAPCSGRTCITTLWPGHPKNAVASGHMGGHFSAEMKFAGWDGLVVQGKASGPVYIAVRDDKVDIVDCPKLWGMGIYKATQEITGSMGPSCQVAAIGQAGENMCVQANVMTGVSHSAGVAGGVLGSKNLKAIGVVGTGSVTIASDKKRWRTLVDNCMTLIGSTYQHVVPDTPQTWAEYWNAGSWWKAKKGSYWEAANPPVETGVADPHDRQSIGYRTNIANRYFSMVGNDYNVRMDGCYGCPLRCHIAVRVPSVERWGSSYGSYAVNTCVGVWLGNMIPTTKFPAGAEGRIRVLEAKVEGVHYGDDYGIWTHYSQMGGKFTFLYGTDMGVNRIKPNVINSTIVPVRFPAQNVDTKNPTVGGASTTYSVNEWNYLWMGTPTMQDSTKTGYSNTTTATNVDTGYPGLFTMLEQGDIGFCKEFARLLAYKIGVFGTGMGAAVLEQMSTWKDAAGATLETPYRRDGSVKMWQDGAPAHHSIEAGGQLMGLAQTGYNIHPQNHSWSNWSESSLPYEVMRKVTNTVMAPYGANIGEGIDYERSAIKPMTREKAIVAKFAIMRKELHDSLGICNWSYPWWSSALKERGYCGDLTVEAQLYSLATGDTKNILQLDKEAARFYVLQRVLTIRSYNDMHMRANHDQLPWWALAANQVPPKTAFDGTNYWMDPADWNTALDLFYDQWGFDRATGAPTRACLTDLGMADVADWLAAHSLLPA